MKSTTLCLIVKNNKLLLAMKKRGFGMGKWNGPGGKVQEAETTEAAAVREVFEEVGLTITEAHLEALGDIKFFFVDNPSYDQHMHVFKVREWQGEPQETEEMKPHWFTVNELPFEAMWVSDRQWLPQLLKEGKVTGEIYFKDGGNEVVESKLQFTKPDEKSEG